MRQAAEHGNLLDAALPKVLHCSGNRAAAEHWD
jgi:hypothetical protein